MLFRAQDKHFVPLLMRYAEMLRNDDLAEPEIKESVLAHIDRAIKWQDTNHTKTPDIPEGAKV